MFDLDHMIDQAVGSLPRGRRGQAKASPSVVREIAPEDLPKILASPAAPPAERPVLRIRHQHHMVAKLLAEGRSLVEVGQITGYTPARIGQLKNDPSFQELLEHYKSQATEKWLNVHERVAALGISITEELQERLENCPEDFSNEELRKLAESLLDRSGFGPSSKKEVSVRSHSVTLTLVEQIKSEAATRRQVKMLEHVNDSSA